MFGKYLGSADPTMKNIKYGEKWGRKKTRSEGHFRV